MNVSTLICHRDVPMGLICLDALVRRVGSVRLVLHDDGTLTREDVADLSRVLPVAKILPRREADEVMHERLARYPACARARSLNVLMLKLFDVALTGGDADVRYCDSDVLFFRATLGLFERSPGGPAAVFMHDSNHAYAVRPWHLLGPAAVRLPRHLNSGLFMFPRNQFDLEYLEWLLSREAIQAVFTRISVWAEQTCWAALAHRAGCGLWDATRIAVVDADWTLDRRAVAAHFVSSSRHRFADALRQMEGGVVPPGSAPVGVSVIESRECTAFELGKSQVHRRLRRACGS